MHAPVPKPRSLEEILTDAGMLSDDQRRIARLEQAKAGLPLGKVLTSLGFVSEATLRDALSESLDRRSVDLSRAAVTPEALELVPRQVARRHRVMPLDFDPAARRLTLAMAEVRDLVGLDRVRDGLPAEVELEVVLAGESEIDRAIDQYYGHELSIDGILHEIETGEPAGVPSRDGPEGYAHPVVRLIDALLADAVKRGASDIHFEPEAGFLRIRYRIDGLLRQVRSLHKSYWPAMAVRIKVMSGMNIAEMRAPQDGRIGLAVSGRPVDFRASCQPTLHGENIVLRVLDRHRGIVPLGDLGLAEDHLSELKAMIARPEGVILVTGPTGSGKTTTLYSLLNHINAEGIHIMTLEDPVEYPMPLVRQTSVADSVKLDFANGIRSMMRQDPDVILVGEIRDADTAEMAFRAAMTGHQVFSTLHTASAIGAIPRLLDIGIRPDILAGNLVGVVAQRLVRRLCDHCKMPDTPDCREARLLGLAEDARRPPVWRPRGCEHCDFQGYRGRLAIMELLAIDPGLEELIARRAPGHEIRTRAMERGFRPLAADGLHLVLAGATSMAEVGRVTDLGARTR